MSRVIRFVSVLGLLSVVGLAVVHLVNHQAGKVQKAVSNEFLDSEKVKIAAEYGKLPLHFEPNVGQTDAQVDFVSRGQGYALFLKDGEAVLALSYSKEDESEDTQLDVVRIQLLNANTSAKVSGVDPLPGKSNYLLGNDQSQWHTNVPHYGKVKYNAVYPSIDLVYYGTEQRLLEYDFVVSPGADPDVIRFSVEGAESLALDADGNLVASIAGGDVILQAPVTYQDIGGERISVESRYEFFEHGVGFELAAYDTNYEVVIDPVLSYATYWGGSGDDQGRGIAIDGSDNAYVVGSTQSLNFPLQSSFQSAIGGSEDAFISVFNPSGSGLIYSTYLGGSNDDRCYAVALDGSGNVFLTGYTGSTDFPLQSAFQATNGGGWDVFVAVLNSAGSGLVYSTYLGGSSNDVGLGIALDTSNRAFVSGYTGSANFPLQSAFQSTYNGSTDGFVSVFNNTGSGLVYSTYLGGSNLDYCWGIALDSSNQAVVTGQTLSTDFPLQSAFQSTNGGGRDVFVSAFNGTGSGLIYSTYLGGSNDDYGYRIALDASDQVFVVGETKSLDFPLQSAFQATHGGGTYDALVSVFNSTGSALIYSTYLGGSNNDYGRGIALDSSANMFLTGYTNSTNFPLQSALQATNGGGFDLFVSALNSTGAGLIYSTYLGGSGDEFSYGQGIALDGSENAIFTGQTQSTNFPIHSALQATNGGLIDAFLGKIMLNLQASLPDTVAIYDTQVLVPIRIGDPIGFDVVAVEVSITFDNSVVTLGSPDKTELTGTLVASGWSVEENVFSGVGGIDTLTIAMSTAADTLSGAGDLIKIVLDVADIRHPDSTPLELVSVLFNDGTPTANAKDGSLTIIGTDGSIVASPDSINPADVVTVTITDADFDVDVGTAEQVTASAVSKVYGDTETVTLIETGVNTGIFIGTLNTSFSLVADPSQNGTLGTVAGDSICVSYLDSLDSVGASVTRVDTVEVIGGTDGTVAISYVVQALDGRNGLRDTVRVQVSDADLDTDVGVAEQVSATVTNTISGEIETLTLTETGLNTGVFQIRVPTIAGASGTNNDGEFSLASWDTLSLSYNDALSAQGGLNVVQDIGRVVNLFGDVRVNDQVQAFDAARLLAISVGLISANTQTTLVGDVDGNSSIQAFDASRVLQYVVRLIDRFGVQTDFVADPKNHPFEKPVPLGNVIALGELESQGDGTFLLPVSLGEREGILSGTLTLGVDAGIEIVDVDLANAYSSFMVAHNMTSEGLKVAFAGSQSEQSGSGDVLMLKVRGVEGSPILLSLDHVVLNGQTLTPSVNIEAMEEVITQAPELITELHQNIPNPFNPQTTIKYAIAEAGQVEMVIYSVTGQRIRMLISEFQDVGAYQIVWDGKDALGRDVSSGVYLMQMQATGFTQTKKMLLLR